jgi:hypothetical protein
LDSIRHFGPFSLTTWPHRHLYFRPLTQKKTTSLRLNLAETAVLHQTETETQRKNEKTKSKKTNKKKRKKR